MVAPRRRAADGRGPRAAPLAAGLRALAFLAVVRAAGAWRFGISLSTNGTFEADYTRGIIEVIRCSYCANVLVALNLTATAATNLLQGRLASIANIGVTDNDNESLSNFTDTGLPRHALGTVSWDVREDGSNLTTCLRNYVQMAQDPSVHALLGPAYALWNERVEEAVEPYGKVLIKWSFDSAVYPNTPVHTPNFQAFLQEAVRTRVDAGTTAPPPNASMILPLPGGDANETSDTSVTSVASPGLSFDLNLPHTSWVYNIIDLIGVRNKTFMFVWFADFPGEPYFTQQCMYGFEYVRSRGGNASYLPLHFYSQFATELGAMQEVWPQAICLCGTDYAFTTLQRAAETRRLSPEYLLVAQPTGQRSRLQNKAYITNYMIEPVPMAFPDLKRPDPLFGDLLHFWLAWHEATGQHPGYEAYQVVSATSLVLETIYTAGMGLSNFNSATLAEQLRRSRTATVIGWLSFDANGRRALGPDMEAVARQLVPVPGVSAARVFKNNLFLVAPGAREICGQGDSTCNAVFHDRLQAFNGDWSAKLLEVSPCAVGCIFQDLACVACPRGRYRGANDVNCKPCPVVETYADVPGTSICPRCPNGADCSNPAGPLMTKATYCRIQPWSGSCTTELPWARRMKTSLTQTAVSGLMKCVEHSNDPAPVYQHCLPVRVCPGGAQTCVGSNRGMLCGQCGSGETYHGFFAGRRKCQACPSKEIVVVRLVAIAIFYMMVLGFISRISRKAAYSQSFLPCPMIRSLVHYMHMMACVCELTRLDAHPVISVIVAPFSFFWRPMELAQASCLNTWHAQRLESEVIFRWEILLSLLMLPVGLFFLLFFHLYWGVCRYMFNQVRGWFSCCSTTSEREAQQKRRKAKKHAHKLKHKGSGLRGSTSSLTVDSTTSGSESPARFRTSVKESLSRSFGQESLAKIGVHWADEGGSTLATVHKWSPAKSKPYLNRLRSKSREAPSADGDRPQPPKSAMKKSAFGMQPEGEAAAAEDTSASKTELSIIARLSTQAGYRKETDTSEQETHEQPEENSYRPPFEGKQFDWNDYPAMRFSRSHDFRYLMRCTDDLWRELFVLVLLVYAPILRSLVLISTCIPLEGTVHHDERLVMDLDVKCSRNHKQTYENVANFFLVSTPIITLIFLRFRATDLFDLKNRQVISVLTSGYKPEAWYWEFVVLLRTGIMIKMLSIPYFALRLIFLNSTLVGFFCLHLVVTPYESHGRWTLDKFERASTLGLILVVVLGSLMREEIDPYIGDAMAYTGPEIALCVLLWNIFAVAGVVFRTFVCEYLMSIQVIVDTGGTFSWTLSHVMRFVNATYGIHLVTYYRDSVSNRFVLDATRLNRSEREFLICSIADTMSACIDSGKTMYTLRLITALRQALWRAKEARAAKLANYYCVHGQRTRTLFCVPCFEANLPDPDANKVFDEKSTSVYVEELHLALRDVSHDIMEHVGPVMKMEPENEKESDSDQDGEAHVTTWGQGDGLKALEQDLHNKGVLTIKGGLHLEDVEGVPASTAMVAGRSLASLQLHTAAVQQFPTEEACDVSRTVSACSSNAAAEDVQEAELHDMFRRKADDSDDYDEDKEMGMTEEDLQKELAELEEEIDALTDYQNNEAVLETETETEEEQQAKEEEKADITPLPRRETSGNSDSEHNAAAAQSAPAEWANFSKHINAAWSAVGTDAWRGLSTENQAKRGPEQAEARGPRA